MSHLHARIVYVYHQWVQHREVHRQGGHSDGEALCLGIPKDHIGRHRTLDCLRDLASLTSRGFLYRCDGCEGQSF
jgi:hypothetical protein